MYALSNLSYIQNLALDYLDKITSVGNKVNPNRLMLFATELVPTSSVWWDRIPWIPNTSRASNYPVSTMFLGHGWWT